MNTRVLFGACLLAILAAGPWAWAGAPTALTCEYQEEPLAVDTPAPRLSWRYLLDEGVHNQLQTAYRIQAARSREALEGGEADLWDTGKVPARQSHLVPYAGPALETGQRCYWRVQGWLNDEPTAWSEIAAWRMGFVDSGDWEAHWISLEAAEEQGGFTGSWVWHREPSPGETVYFRRAFESDAAADGATLRISCDNEYELFLNGRRLGVDSAWEEPEVYGVSEHLRAGENILAVRAVNTDGPGGLLVTLRLDGGEETVVATDAEWRVSKEASGEWTAADYDDADWARATVVAAYGEEPWGDLTGHQTGGRSIVVRKAFELAGVPEEAILYASGLGAYALNVNGQAPRLTPGWTRYPDRVQYQAYDITDDLRVGMNVIEAHVGNGWWGSGMPGSNYDGALRFIAEVHGETDRGFQRLLVTDASWEAAQGPYLENSIYHGTVYEAGAVGEWQPAQVNPAPTQRRVAQAAPLIQAHEPLRAIEITEPEPGVFVYDFGQNMAGVCRLLVPEGATEEIRLRHAEVLKDDGTLYTENLRSARATDVYRPNGEADVFEPRFTYHGFRYAELTGYPDTPTADTLVAVPVYTHAPRAGEFACGNDLINVIYGNILWGQRSNMHSVPTDCPQRDERLGWTGDALVFARTACWNMHMARFFHKWLADLRDSRNEETGWVTDVAPTSGGGPASPGWGDAAVVVPYLVWRFYGDTRIIEDNYEMMRDWVDYMAGEAEGHLYKREGYGDWVAPVNSPKQPIGAAYYFWSTTLLAEMAEVIGKPDQAAELAGRAETIKAAFNEAYLREADYPGGTQTAKALPLYFGLVPMEEYAAVANSLYEDVVERGMTPSTGFLGTSYLLPVLSEAGYHEAAWQLATQTAYPSWGYTVEHGATTIWERWNSNRIEEVGAGMNSFNHFAFGSVGRWYYEYLAGVKPLAPGFERFEVAPQPAGDLSEAEARYVTPYGPVYAAWRLADGRFWLDVEVPVNTRAVVRLPEGASGVDTPVPANPDGSYAIGSGRYAFSADYAG